MRSGISYSTTPTTCGLAVLATLASCDLTVTVRNGTYAGLSLLSFNQDAFLGVPYAQDAGGLNRFRVPQALNTTWTGTRNAKNYSRACPDPNRGDALYGMGENCLSINIVRPCKPKSDTPLPVAVWIHGGSYHYRTTTLPNYNLSYIVQRSGTISCISMRQALSSGSSNRTNNTGITRTQSDSSNLRTL